MAPEPLVIQRTGSSPVSRYSCLHSHSRAVHGTVPRPLRPTRDALLPNGHKGRCRVFGGVLEPRYIVGAEPLDSELLRTLSRMAASEPTSWLSMRLHILSHLAHASGP